MSYTLSGLRRFALAAALFGFAASAQAVVEIQWWHSMTGKLGDKVNEIATEIQRLAVRLQGHARLQGPVRRIDGGGDRRVPCRQPAADRPDLRGRDGDDDGGPGRDQARLPADGGGGREVRSEGVSRRRVRLLLGHAGQAAVDAVQQQLAGSLHQRRRVQEGRPRSQPSRRRRGRKSAGGGKAQGVGRSPAPSRPAGNRGCSSKASAPGTTCRSPPRRTASAASTRGSTGTSR